MLLDDARFRLDQMAKFHRSLWLFGWFHCAGDALATVTIHGPGLLGESVGTIGLAHDGVVELGQNLGFSLQILLARDDFPAQATLRFTTAAGRVIEAPLADLADEARAAAATVALTHRFRDEMQALPSAHVLDLGGRARSGSSMRDQFTVARYTVADVLPGPGVDIVADAHHIARHLPAGSIDGALSVSVFEHLLMPWAVVAQLNRVLRPGGLVLVFTHQTLGMHDRPWDFWRFSDTAWDALFNHHTGFTIEDRALDRPQFVIPHIWRESNRGVEGAVGYEGSAVLARKTGPCRMEWPLAAGDVIESMYPER